MTMTEDRPALFWEECLHCGRERPPARRGLCGECYRDRTIRPHYQPLILNVRLPPYLGEPTDATDALPGTEAKIKVMLDRAAKGLGIFHAKDARR